MAEKIIGIALVIWGSLIIGPEEPEKLVGLLMLIIGVSIIVGKLKES